MKTQRDRLADFERRSLVRNVRMGLWKLFVCRLSERTFEMNCHVAWFEESSVRKLEHSL